MMFFLCTSLNPPTSIISASSPKITANVTTAPMTPDTVLEIPELFPEWDAEPEPVELVPRAEAAQVPVVFPHLTHHSSVVLTAKEFIFETNVSQGRVGSEPPKSG